MSVAWLVTPVPLTTDTVTVDGAGRGSPVMVSVAALMARNWSITWLSWVLEGNSMSP